MSNDEPDTENHSQETNQSSKAKTGEEKVEGESNDEDEELAESYKSHSEVTEEVFPEMETVYGVSVSGNPDDNPKLKRLVRDVNEHGEVHATVENHEKELEIRQGTAFVNFETGLVNIDTPAGYNNTVVTMDSIVDWYKPMSAWD